MGDEEAAAPGFDGGGEGGGSRAGTNNRSSSSASSSSSRLSSELSSSSSLLLNLSPLLFLLRLDLSRSQVFLAPRSRGLHVSCISTLPSSSEIRSYPKKMIISVEQERIREKEGRRFRRLLTRRVPDAAAVPMPPPRQHVTTTSVVGGLCRRCHGPSPRFTVPLHLSLSSPDSSHPLVAPAQILPPKTTQTWVPSHG